MGLFFIVKDQSFVPCTPPANLDNTAISGELVYQACNDVDLQYSLQTTATGVTLRVRGEDLTEQSIPLPSDYASQDYFILIEPDGTQKVQLKTVSEMGDEVSTLAGVVPNLKSYHERFWNIISTEKYATETKLYNLVSKLRASPTELSDISVEKENLLKRLGDLEQSLSSLSLQLGKTPLPSSRGEILYLFEKYAPQPVKEPSPLPKPDKSIPVEPAKPTHNDAIRKHTEALGLQRQIYETIIALNQLKDPSEAATIATLRTKAQALLAALDRAEKELKVLHEQLNTPPPTLVHAEIKAQFEQAAQRAETRTQVIAGREVTQAPMIHEARVAQPRRTEPNPEEKRILVRRVIETALPPTTRAEIERERLETEARKRQTEASAAEKRKATQLKIAQEFRDGIKSNYETALAAALGHKPRTTDAATLVQATTRIEKQLSLTQVKALVPKINSGLTQAETNLTRLKSVQTDVQPLINESQTYVTGLKTLEKALQTRIETEAGAALAKARQEAEYIAEKVSEDGQELSDRSGNILNEKNHQTLESFAAELQTAIANARKELPKIAKLGLADPKIKNAHERVDAIIKQLEVIHKDITDAATKLPKSGEVAGQPATFTGRKLTTKDVSHEDKPITYVEFPSNMNDWDKPEERQTMAKFLAHYRVQYPNRKIGIVFYGKKDKFEKAITKAINLANEILQKQKGKLFTGKEFDIIPYAEPGDPGRPFIKFYFLTPGLPSLDTRIGGPDEAEAFKRPFYGVIDDLVTEVKHRPIPNLDFDIADAPTDVAEQAFTNVGFAKVSKGPNYVAIAFEYFKGDQKALTAAGEQILRALILLKKPKIKTEGIVVFYNGDDSIQSKLFKPLVDAGFSSDGIFRPIGSLHENRDLGDKLREGENGSKERILVLFSFPGDDGASILQSIYTLERAKANPRERINKASITKYWFERSKDMIEAFYPK